MSPWILDSDTLSLFLHGEPNVCQPTGCWSTKVALSLPGCDLWGLPWARNLGAIEQAHGYYRTSESESADEALCVRVACDKEVVSLRLSWPLVISSPGHPKRCPGHAAGLMKKE